MSTIPSASTMMEDTTGTFRHGGLVVLLKSWCLAYFTWRIERAAVDHLMSMSDRQLKDIGGLTRGQIKFAVKGRPSHRTAMLLS